VLYLILPKGFNNMIKIAIDGPSGSGKSTLAKNIAKTLGLVYVDTGALYRTVGLYAQRAGITVENASEISKHLNDVNVSIEYIDGSQHVILNNEDVSDLIRTPEISMYASAVSAVPAVRKHLLELQKLITSKGNVIMDGRDIGTVIMPDADVKIYLEPSPEERAHRRYEELLEKGQQVKEADVVADMKKRDHNDSNRAIAPAKPADDAIFLDNTKMKPEETLAAALEIIDQKLNRSI